MPTILLIRHGENDYVKKGRLAGRLSGVHLNKKGRKQAEELAKALTHAPIKAIYSSPLERTMETAEPIAQALGQKVIPRKGLLEIDFGEWQDQTLKSLRQHKQWKMVQQFPSLWRFPGGESFAEAQQRGVREIEALCAKHSNQDIFACVCHSDLIKLIVAFYQGLPLDMFQRIMVAPASLSTVHINEGGSFIVNVNVPTSLQFPQAKPEKKTKKSKSEDKGKKAKK